MIFKRSVVKRSQMCNSSESLKNVLVEKQLEFAVNVVTCLVLL